MAYAQPATSFADLARPFAWIAAAAFLTGFLLGLAVYLGRLAGEHDAGPQLRPPLDVSAPAEMWNPRKAV